MGKNARKHREAHDEQVARYERLADEALRALQPQLQRLDPPIVDSLPIADFSGRPENLYIWYAFRDHGDQQQAEASASYQEELRQLTQAHFRRSGYPPDAVPTIRLFFANRAAIDAAGGDFYLYVK